MGSYANMITGTESLRLKAPSRVGVVKSNTPKHQSVAGLYSLQAPHVHKPDQQLRCAPSTLTVRNRLARNRLPSRCMSSQIQVRKRAVNKEKK